MLKLNYLLSGFGYRNGLVGMFMFLKSFSVIVLLKGCARYGVGLFLYCLSNFEEHFFSLRHEIIFTVSSIVL